MFEGLLNLADAVKFFAASLLDIVILIGLAWGFISFIFPLIGKYRNYANDDSMTAGEIWKSVFRDLSLILGVAIVAISMMVIIGRWGNVLGVLDLFWGDIFAEVGG